MDAARQGEQRWGASAWNTGECYVAAITQQSSEPVAGQRQQDIIRAWSVALMVPFGAWGLWSGFALLPAFLTQVHVQNAMLQADLPDVMFVSLGLFWAAVGSLIGWSLGYGIGKVVTSIGGRS